MRAPKEMKVAVIWADILHIMLDVIYFSSNQTSFRMVHTYRTENDCLQVCANFSDLLTS